MPKFEDLFLVGKETGPVNIRITGDNDELGRSMIGQARNLLGQLKQQTQLGGIRQNSHKVRYVDGSSIFVHTILGEDGSADIDSILIDVGGKKEAGKHRCYGYILQGYTVDEVLDPYYDNYLYFPVTFGTDSLDPTDGVDAVNVSFDNYPDFGAKYVIREGSKVDEVFVASYKRTFGASPGAEPARLDFSGPLEAPLPTPAAGWSWSTADTCVLKLSSAHTIENPNLGVSRGFFIMTGTPSLEAPNPWTGYPGDPFATQFLEDYDTWSWAQQASLGLPFVNAVHQRRFDDFLIGVGEGNEYYYNDLDNIVSRPGSSVANWIRKHKDDYGFTANMGLYHKQSTWYLADRDEKNNDVTVYQGFLYMVPSNPELRLTEQVIDNNFFTSEDLLDIPSFDDVACGWVEDYIDYVPCAGPAGYLQETPIIIGTGQLPVFNYTPVVGKSTDTILNEATRNPFNIRCKVLPGWHEAKIKRRATIADVKYKVRALLYTDEGIFERIVTGFTFEDAAVEADTRLRIWIGEYENINEVLLPRKISPTA